MRPFDKSFWDENEKVSEAAITAVEAISKTRESLVLPLPELRQVVAEAATEAFGPLAGQAEVGTQLLAAVRHYLDRVHRIRLAKTDEDVHAQDGLLVGAKSGVVFHLVDGWLDVIERFEETFGPLGAEAITQARDQAYDRFIAAIDRAFPEGKPLFDDGHQDGGAGLKVG